MAATLRDVAELAQVSVRTVSNVVSDYVHVSTEMRERVLQAIRELDYRPNPVARTLRTGKTGLVALVVPEIDVPFFGQLARDVIEAAAGYDYRVLIHPTRNDHERERELLLGRGSTMLVDGMVFSPSVTPLALQDLGAVTSMPLVLLGEHRFDGRFDHVAIDNVAAAKDAVSHLTNLGRRRIAAIGSQPLEDYETPQQRRTGYERALLEAGVPLDGQLVIPAQHYSRRDGYDAARRLMTEHADVDAIFCFSDLLAIGAIRAIFDLGLRVPEDVAVIGVDDIEEGRYLRPSLSTIALDTEFIAEEAVRRLVGRIQSPGIAAVEVVAGHRLVIRESTACSGSAA